MTPPHTLTGNKRFRSERRWGKERLILQVEWKGHVTRFTGAWPETNTETYWKDARTEDISMETLKPGKSPER